MSVQICRGRIRTERKEVHSYTGGLELRMTETETLFKHWNFIMFTMENKISLKSFTEVTFVLRLGKCIFNYLTQL